MFWGHGIGEEARALSERRKSPYFWNQFSSDSPIHIWPGTFGDGQVALDFGGGILEEFGAPVYIRRHPPQTVLPGNCA